MISFGFLLTSLIVVVIPGTGVIYTVTTSLSGNKRQAILAALGCTLGILPHILAAIMGISALMNTSAQLFRIIRIAGIIYLLYLGYDLIKNNSKINISESKPENAFKVIGKAILINLLNPKLTLFFFSFLPQFIIKGNAGVRFQMIVLSSAFMIITFIIFSLYGLLANYFKSFLMNSPKIKSRIQKGFGMILIFFAGKLAIDDL